MRSIRRDLVLGLSIGTAVCAALAGLISGRAIEVRLRQDFDDSLLAKAQAIVSLTSQEAGVIEIEFADEAMPEFSVRQPLEYFELWSSTGGVIERSRSLGRSHLARSAARLGERSFTDGILPDGRRGRIVAIVFDPQVQDDEDDTSEVAEPGIRQPVAEGQSAQLAVARGTDELESLVRSVYLANLAVAVGLALALALLVGYVIRRGFAPLGELARNVGALDEHSLGKRLVLERPVLELEPILRRLNLLLERLEGAFARERRFSGDVAHELRTPVTELRTLAEVGERWPGDADLARSLFRDTSAVASRMERTVEQLLELARLEAGREAIVAETFDLGALVEENLAADAGDSPDLEGRVILRLERSLAIVTDREKLSVILRNLIDNARTYSRNGTPIEIESRADRANGFVLEVSNEAAQLAAEDLGHLFERFWRKDPARSDAGHSGLGLSLVRSLCDLLGFDIAATLRAGDRRLTFTIAGPVRRDGVEAPPV